jgi:hypothetical protein
MKILVSIQRKKRRASGQIMAEAAIGLAILAFTWILATVFTFMAGNQLRTAMAARHAAWYQGESKDHADIQVDDLEEQFFYQKGFTEIRRQPNVTPLGALSDNIQSSILAGGETTAVTVSFGLTDLNDDRAKTYPFVLFKTRVPFMPEENDLANLLKVESSCQWDETGDPWLDGHGALSWVWKQLKSGVRDLAHLVGL